MTSDQFAYWLQGFTELHGEPPTAEQWQAIKDHLALVFHKVTPSRQPAQRLDDLLRQPSDATPWAPKDWNPLLERAQCAVSISDHPSTRAIC